MIWKLSDDKIERKKKELERKIVAHAKDIFN